MGGEHGADVLEEYLAAVAITPPGTPPVPVALGLDYTREDEMYWRAQHPDNRAWVIEVTQKIIDKHNKGSIPFALVDLAREDEESKQRYSLLMREFDAAAAKMRAADAARKKAETSWWQRTRRSRITTVRTPLSNERSEMRWRAAEKHLISGNKRRQQPAPQSQG